MTKNPYDHVPPASQPEALAYDIHVLAAHALRDPNGDYCTTDGINRVTALLADAPDSTAVISEIATVARWVLFVTDFNAEYAPLSDEDADARAAAGRVLALLDAIQSHASHLTNRTGDS